METNCCRILGLSYPTFDKNGCHFYNNREFLRSVSELSSLVHNLTIFFFRSIENYRFESFRKNLQDPKIAMQMSVEILTLELLHRFIVCCYEVCLKRREIWELTANFRCIG